MRYGGRVYFNRFLSSVAVDATIRELPTKDLTEGPFDPDAASVEQETMRSGAFDAVERPVVSTMAASKISVISEGLSVGRFGMKHEGLEKPRPKDPKGEDGVVR